MIIYHAAVFIQSPPLLVLPMPFSQKRPAVSSITMLTPPAGRRLSWRGNKKHYPAYLFR